MSLQEKIEELEADLRAYAENAARWISAIYAEASAAVKASKELAGFAAEPLLALEDGKVVLMRLSGPASSGAYEALVDVMRAACGKYGCRFDVEAEFGEDGAELYAAVYLC